FFAFSLLLFYYFFFQNGSVSSLLFLLSRRLVAPKRFQESKLLILSSLPAQSFSQIKEIYSLHTYVSRAHLGKHSFLLNWRRNGFFFFLFPFYFLEKEKKSYLRAKLS